MTYSAGRRGIAYLAIGSSLEETETGEDTSFHDEIAVLMSISGFLIHLALYSMMSCT